MRSPSAGGMPVGAWQARAGQGCTSHHRKHEEQQHPAMQCWQGAPLAWAGCMLVAAPGRVMRRGGMLTLPRLRSCPGRATAHGALDPSRSSLRHVLVAAAGRAAFF